MKQPTTLRGYLLADAPQQAGAILTVELYSKWYSLVLLYPDGSCTVAPFPGDEYAPPGESAYRDHVPNPRAVMKYAKFHSIVLGERAIELIVGRWHLETTEEYDE